MRKNPEKSFDLPLNEDEPHYALFNAARNGDLEALKAQINAGADINAKTIQDEYSLVHYAANRGDCEMLQWLKEKGANIFVRSKLGISGLHFAGDKGQLSVVQWYLESGADLNDQSQSGRTVVHYAAVGEQIEIFDWLKAKGGDIFAKDKKGVSGLHIAADKGNLSVVQWYLENGANLNDQTLHGLMAVHFASAGGHIEVLDWLKANGADMFAKDKSGQFGLHMAADKGRLSVVQWYLKNGANLSDQTQNGETVVHVASMNGRAEILEWLKANGADMFAKDKHGWSGLHDAARNGHLSVIQWYLKNGANLSDQTRDGRTVVHAASLNGRVEILEWLKANGADMFVKTKKGWSGLHEAAVWGRLSVIQWYVKNSHYTAFEIISEIFTLHDIGIIESEKNNLKRLSGFFLQDPNCLLDRSKKFNQVLFDNLHKVFEKALENKSLQNGLQIRANFTKSYQEKEFGTFLNAMNDPLYAVFFKADIKTFIQGKHPMLEGIIEEFLGFLFQHYQIAGPRCVLAELGAQLHDHYMEARRVDVEGAFHETDYHNLMLSTLCILTQALSNPVYQGIYCMNLSALIGFKIKDKVYGVSTVELIRNYPNEVDHILQELKELYEQYIGRKLDDLEPSLFDPQMRLILKEKLNQVEKENQELKKQLNEFHKQPRNEEADNADFGIKKTNFGFFTGHKKEETKAQDPSAPRKHEREEGEDLDDLMECEDNKSHKMGSFFSGTP